MYQIGGDDRTYSCGMSAAPRDAPSVDPLRTDAVLRVTPPRFSPADACSIAAATFAVDAATATNLGSERDQAFLLRGANGEPLAVMKVSNSAEEPGTLDMEALAALRVADVDPSVPVAIPWVVPGADPGSAAAYRARLAADGVEHWLRVYSVIPGRARADAQELGDEALIAWGETSARVGRALRGFIHPNAIRTLPWDVHHAATCVPMLPSIADARVRGAVAAVLDHFQASVAPALPALRSQVLHGDLSIDNALVDDAGFVTGIIDFGDMSHTSLVADLAAVLESMATGRAGDDMFRVARLLLDGYQRITPLEPDELALVADLWAVRCAVTVAISSWRAANGLEEPAFAERCNGTAMVMLDHILSTGWEPAARMLGAPRARGNGDLTARRAAVLGPAMEALSYTEPIEMASASGVWMTDVDGRRFLDMYNNVPCVGHAHPRVANAIARQSRLLNTNMRYLHGAAIELAERLVATCPPGLDTVFFVNSGSEANDLAWRLATTATGNTGGLCTAFAYHGISHAIAPLSPETRPPREQLRHIERWRPTDTYRGLYTDTADFEAALARLVARGVAPAATILDGVLQSDGVHDLAPAYVQRLEQLTRAAGGLWIADEVQGGHGRTGETMWSFARFGIEPDLVTLGKPMGNGHPVAAVITRRAIAERFAAETVFFSTFGGNQVSVAAAHAVLDVLDDERVLPRVEAAGERLRAAVRATTAADERIGDVRGIGLANAIEVVTDRSSTVPDAAMAAAIRDGLRSRGVLVGTTGAAGNILKVRPPLAFTADHVPLFTDALAATLHSLA